MTLRIQALIAAGCLLLAFLGGYALRGLEADRDIAALNADFSDERTALATKQTAAVETARTEERRVAFRIQENADASYLRQLQLQADARRADAAARSLRDELTVTRDAYRALAARDSASDQECRAAAGTAAVLAELLARVSEERRELAEYADRAAAAGHACVGAYRALSPLQIRPEASQP